MLFLYGCSIKIGLHDLIWFDRYLVSHMPQKAEAESWQNERVVIDIIIEFRGTYKYRI